MTDQPPRAFPTGTLTVLFTDDRRRQAFRESDVTSPPSRSRLPQSAEHNFTAILREILLGYALPVDGYHGVIHWARVLENGLRLAEVTHADPEVVTLFALFHDSRRVNESWDHGHGQRGGDLARSLRGKLVHLPDRQFDLLHEACRLHTDGRLTGDPTLLACWDADRLDLGRVGVVPHPKRLCTDAARELLPLAHARAVDHYVPLQILQRWGIELGAA